MKTLREINNLLIIIIILAIAALGYFAYQNFIANPTSSTPVNQKPSENTINDASDDMAQSGNPVPTLEYVYIRNDDMAGLQAYLDKQAKNWLNMSMTIHSGNVAGVTPKQGSLFAEGPLSVAPTGAAIWEDVHTEACEWPYADINPLCLFYKVGFTSVYKGIITGGVDSNFILHPVVTLKRDDNNNIIWKEIKRETKDGVVEVTFGGIAVVTFTGNVCVTSVEESTFSLVHQGSEAPTDKSYTIRVEEIHNWSGDTDINEEFLRNIAEGQAKTIALLPEKVTTLYGFIHDDMLPGGKFYEDVKSFYSPELAAMYGVAEFEVVFVFTDGDPLLRCDGTPINK